MHGKGNVLDRACILFFPHHEWNLSGLRRVISSDARRREVVETHEELLPEFATINNAISVSIFDIRQIRYRLRVGVIYLAPNDFNFSKRFLIIPLKILAFDPE